jgi:sulfur-oxidizing protein SoxZ
MSDPRDIGEAKVLLPSQIRRGTTIHVRAMIVHPMLTGLSRDAQGNPIPAHFIREVVVTHAGERIARFSWTSGVSRDPYVAFPMRATREGPLEVTWRDNEGGEWTERAEVRFEG